jgi:hypothetical protein
MIGTAPEASFRPRPEEHPCKSIDLHGCVSKDEGCPGVASCFETHRSAFVPAERLSPPRAAMLLSMRPTDARPGDPP